MSDGGDNAVNHLTEKSVGSDVASSLSLSPELETVWDKMCE